MFQNITVITAAIVSRQILEVEYEPGRRRIEPHTLGRSRDGHLLLRAYQIAGASVSGEHENWKLFRVDRASFIGPIGLSFNGPRPDYKRGDRGMTGGIIAEL